MDKARSLLEAQGNLDELDEGFPEADAGDDIPGHAPRAKAAGARGSAHPSGFVPASVSQSGFSPAQDRGEPSGLHARPSGVESGIHAGGPRPAGGQLPQDPLIDSLQGALGAASRNEAGLGSIQRALRDASRAFTASRQAHESLTDELRVMHRGLNELMSEKAAVERYAALLTQERDAALDAADEARREAKRDRDFLLREQDRFIQLLLEEHEAEVQQLRRSLVQRPSGAGNPALSTTTAAPPSVTPSSSVNAGLSSAAPASGAPLPGVSSAIVSPGAVGSDLDSEEASPATVPGLSPTRVDQLVEDRKSTPPGELDDASVPRLSGAALARQALANAGGNEPSIRALPLPAGGSSLLADSSGQGAALDARRSEVRVEDTAERAPSYPPAPTVLDLDSLAAEVDGNSERPPPIRRINIAQDGFAQNGAAPIGIARIGVADLAQADTQIHVKPVRVQTQLFDTLVSPIGDPDPDPDQKG